MLYVANNLTGLSNEPYVPHAQQKNACVRTQPLPHAPCMAGGVNASFLQVCTSKQTKQARGRSNN